MKKTTLLSEDYVQEEIETLFLHIERFFELNNSMLKNIIAKTKPSAYAYAVKVLYKHLVTNNFIRIITKYKDNLK